MIASERDANVRFDYVSQGFGEHGGGGGWMTRRGEAAGLSPAQGAQNPCLRGHAGGIKTPRRGWTPSIWEMSI